MPRQSKGPRLELKRYKDRPPAWVIRDGGRTLGTGCDECNRKLADYILKKHDPAKAIDKNNPNQAKIADVLSLEMQHIAKSDISDQRKAALIRNCQRIGNWFGEHVVGDLNGELQERYAVERVSQACAWVELKILAAAINRFL